MPVTILNRWSARHSRIPWSRWEGIEEYYLDKTEFDRSMLSSLAPKHPAFEAGFRFNDWVHFVPSDTVTRLRSSKEFESEYTDIIRETFNNIERDLDDEIIPLVGQYNDDYAQESAYEDRRQAVEAFLCRVLTLQMRGDVNFETIETGDTGFPAEASLDPPTKTTSVTVERYSDLNQGDVVRFSISNPLEFFKTKFGDNTLMFERLLNSDKEPESVEASIEISKVSAGWRIHTGISYPE